MLLLDADVAKHIEHILVVVINECDPEKPRHECEHICVDQTDGYTCVCRDGYRLLDNRKDCTGTTNDYI